MVTPFKRIHTEYALFLNYLYLQVEYSGKIFKDRREIKNFIIYFFKKAYKCAVYTCHNNGSDPYTFNSSEKYKCHYNRKYKK